MLSKPKLTSSAGKLAAGSSCVPRRSRVVFRYSVWLRRCMTSAPTAPTSPPPGPPKGSRPSELPITPSQPSSTMSGSRRSHALPSIRVILTAYWVMSMLGAHRSRARSATLCVRSQSASPAPRGLAGLAIGPDWGLPVRSRPRARSTWGPTDGLGDGEGLWVDHGFCVAWQSALFATRILCLEDASPQSKTGDEVGADHLPELASSIWGFTN